jgi:hypothetical protein
MYLHLCRVHINGRHYNVCFLPVQYISPLQSVQLATQNYNYRIRPIFAASTEGPRLACSSPGGSDQRDVAVMQVALQQGTLSCSGPTMHPEADSASDHRAIAYHRRYQCNSPAGIAMLPCELAHGCGSREHLDLLTCHVCSSAGSVVQSCAACNDVHAVLCK